MDVINSFEDICKNDDIDRLRQSVGYHYYSTVLFTIACNMNALNIIDYCIMNAKHKKIVPCYFQVFLHACKTNNYNLALLVYNKGKEFLNISTKYFNGFCYACKNGNLALCKLIIDLQPNLSSETIINSLINSTQYCHYEIYALIFKEFSSLDLSYAVRCMYNTYLKSNNKIALKKLYYGSNQKYKITLAQVEKFYPIFFKEQAWEMLTSLLDYADYFPYTDKNDEKLITSMFVMNVDDIFIKKVIENTIKIGIKKRLIQACSYGKISIIYLIVGTNHEIDLSFDNNILLLTAFKHGYFDICNYLLNKINTPTFDSCFLLNQCCVCGSVLHLKWLYDKNLLNKASLVNYFNVCVKNNNINICYLLCKFEPRILLLTDPSTFDNYDNVTKNALLTLYKKYHDVFIQNLLLTLPVPHIISIVKNKKKFIEIIQNDYYNINKLNILLSF